MTILYQRTVTRSTPNYRCQAPILYCHFLTLAVDSTYPLVGAILGNRGFGVERLDNDQG